ncbi:trichome birefringence-like 14 [Zostera marina]|uniref:Trichome birefringence-like 14 n=1 Tax=Zostera marina TaxID=29655 RepID=A0A0K9P4C5_ZOSMR|nr:trichome birefringence-like 14 [Zostera marina]
MGKKLFTCRMRNKTIAFMGDSLGRQQFQSMMCMASGGGRLDSEVDDVGEEYNFVKPINAFVNGSTAYRFRTTNTTILFYWSVSLCKLKPSSPGKADYFALHIDRPEPFLIDSLHMIDVLVLNTKHHWSEDKLKRNRWVIHKNGLPVRDKNLSASANARNFAISSVVRWLDSQHPKHPGLKVFFRTLSPRHFVNGDWNTGGKCDSTTPLAYGDRITTEIGSYDSPVFNAVQGTSVKVLDVTGLSRLRDEAHVSKFRILTHLQYDCLHWCLPGVPDEWNKILYAQI